MERCVATERSIGVAVALVLMGSGWFVQPVWAIEPETSVRATLDQWEAEDARRPFSWTLERTLEEVESAGKQGAEPSFPWLPGEDASSSRSVGDVTSGWIVGAVPVPESSCLKILPRQRARGLRYGSGPLMELLAAGSRAVCEEGRPGALWVGNVGRFGGGDIPWSVSHNSGRDADLAFLSTDPQGRPVDPPGFLHFGDDGRSLAYGGWYRFDVARNWAVIEALLRHPAAEVQYLFVSNGLRSLLLRHAAETGVHPSVRQRAAAVLRQPGPEIPHNDHLHVRIFCSPDDLASGCVDRGVMHAWRPDPGPPRQQALRRVLLALDHEDPAVRQAGLQRMKLLSAQELSRQVLPLLADPSPWVRREAVRTWAELERTSAARALVSRWDQETDPLVREALLEGLGVAGGSEAIALLMRVARQSTPLEGIAKTGDLRGVAVSALERLQHAPAAPVMAALLDVRDPYLRAQAASSLRMLAVRDVSPLDWGDATLDPERLEESARRWQAWAAGSEGQTRQRWLEDGFALAGYALPAGAHARATVLATAVADPRRWVSANAQRELMRMSGNEPRSLTWSRHDANVYWTRWVRRNPHRFR